MVRARTIQSERSFDIKYEKFLVTTNTLKKFKQPEYRRHIRSGAVARLYSELLEDNTFKSPLHINEVDGIWRVIDGNHRIDAITMFLARFPESAIEIPIAIHVGLSIEEERELFDELAMTVTQTKSDLIKIHFDELEILKKIDDRFPVKTSIYSKSDALSYLILVNTWLDKDKDQLMIRDRARLVDSIKGFNNDYSEMKKFFTRYSELFGLPSATSPYYKTGTLWLIMSLYFRNREFAEEDKLWLLLKEKCFGSFLIMETFKKTSREWLADVRRQLLEKLNKSWRGNKLI